MQKETNSNTMGLPRILGIIGVIFISVPTFLNFLGEILSTRNVSVLLEILFFGILPSLLGVAGVVKLWSNPIAGGFLMLLAGGLIFFDLIREYPYYIVTDFSSLVPSMTLICGGIIVLIRTRTIKSLR